MSNPIRKRYRKPPITKGITQCHTRRFSILSMFVVYAPNPGSKKNPSMNPRCYECDEIVEGFIERRSHAAAHLDLACQCVFQDCSFSGSPKQLYLHFNVEGFMERRSHAAAHLDLACQCVFEDCSFSGSPKQLYLHFNFTHGSSVATLSDEQLKEFKKAKTEYNEAIKEAMATYFPPKDVSVMESTTREDSEAILERPSSGGEDENANDAKKDKKKVSAREPMESQLPKTKDQCAKCGKRVRSTAGRRIHVAKHLRTGYECVFEGCKHKADPTTFYQHFASKHLTKVQNLSEEQQAEFVKMKAHYKRAMKAARSKYFPDIPIGRVGLKKTEKVVESDPGSSRESSISDESASDEEEEPAKNVKELKKKKSRGKPQDSQRSKEADSTQGKTKRELLDTQCTECGKEIRSYVGRRTHVALHLKLKCKCIFEDCEYASTPNNLYAHFSSEHFTKVESFSKEQLIEFNTEKAHFSRTLREVMAKYFPSTDRPRAESEDSDSEADTKR
uniref:C2H2-type domain-containing protein n=1 Tax=Steinernema glaseri TaxID=37863 RepID=A0A1I7Y800_9BILA